MASDKSGALPVALLVCPLCWNTTQRTTGDRWCTGGEWGVAERPADGDHEAELMRRVEFIGAREYGADTDYVAVSALRHVAGPLSYEHEEGSSANGSRLTLEALLSDVAESRTHHGEDS